MANFEHASVDRDNNAVFGDLWSKGRRDGGTAEMAWGGKVMSLNRNSPVEREIEHAKRGKVIEILQRVGQVTRMMTR